MMFALREFLVKRLLAAPKLLFVRFVILFLVSTTSISSAADFSVTTPGFFYSINGQDFNPTLTLTRGVTYTFSVNAEFDHPFEIVSDNETGTPYTDGVTGNNTSQGTITLTVPLDAPDTLFYICSIHFFGGIISIVNPPPPPVPFVKVLSITLTESNVTLASSGTNGWKAVPEFTSNLTTRSWITVPSYTNSFANGTNVTRFSRLEAICGPNVLLRIRNTTNSMP